ncbi:hypothetical protein GIB67_017351 [Kingdonia uniflora]|uniref:non-specific serine/threonine protein kinase n=1 Tax=Kingdonia uniflora TaxID=39325 RepID=A0A7J7MPS3_9MAGN|nr:hypothetical protein GIB67_017351 [Kingdonia uniflora]
MAMYYVIFVGRVPGVYETWEEIHPQVSGFRGVVYRRVNSRAEADLLFAAFVEKERHVQGGVALEVEEAPPVVEVEKAEDVEDLGGIAVRDVHGWIFCLVLACVGVQTHIDSAYKLYLNPTIEASAIPAIEVSCRTMFDQVNATFQKGMVEHTAAAHRQFESSPSQLVLALRDTINSTSSMTQTLTGELADGQRKLLALAIAKANSNAVNPLVKQLSNGPLGGLHDMVEVPLDPTKELSRLIAESKYEEAFMAALQRSDVSIVSWLCSQEIFYSFWFPLDMIKRRPQYMSNSRTFFIHVDENNELSLDNIIAASGAGASTTVATNQLLVISDNQIIGWEQLNEIAIGTANGIAYLHEECEQRIIHYDIKPGNILLDINFSPKVADFGLAKLCNRDNSYMIMTGCKGTLGYAALELWMPYPVTHKCDVYSFEILLFEIIGRRRHHDDSLNQSQEWLPRWVWEKFEKRELDKMMELYGIEEKNREKAERMSMVALWCVQYLPEARPLMSTVVKMLEGGLEISSPSNPFDI